MLFHIAAVAQAVECGAGKSTPSPTMQGIHSVSCALVCIVGAVVAAASMFSPVPFF